MSNITIGSDPEVFIEGKEGIVPVIGLLGGTKHKPIVVDKGALQEDNVLGEFNTDPASSSTEFCNNIRTVMSQMEDKIKPYKIKVLSSHHFEKSVLTSAGTKALEFGCNPDTNAWSGKENEKPSPYTTLRTAGGHVHVGFDVASSDKQSRYDVIKLMDIYLGIPSVLLDEDVERRNLYGQAGACRLKSYGVEYRVLSNFWLRSDEYIKWVFDQSVRAVNNRNYIKDLLGKYSSKVIQDTINNSDVSKASEIVDSLQLEVV